MLLCMWSKWCLMCSRMCNAFVYLMWWIFILSPLPPFRTILLIAYLAAKCLLTPGNGGRCCCWMRKNLSLLSPPVRQKAAGQAMTSKAEVCFLFLQTLQHSREKGQLLVEEYEDIGRQKSQNLSLLQTKQKVKGLIHGRELCLDEDIYHQLLISLTC